MMFIKECLSRAHAPIPRTFAGLMELYEANYMRIRRLCPGLDTIPYYAVSRVENTLDLHIQILDRCKYTTTILLTYYFQEGLGHWRPNPNLEVRVYHDARQAEVLSRSYRSPRSRRHVQTWKGQSELVKRWNFNRSGWGFVTIKAIGLRLEHFTCVILGRLSGLIAYSLIQRDYEG
jgi:uncharacterized protein YqiB (DUF1249 family)